MTPRTRLRTRHLFLTCLLAVLVSAMPALAANWSVTLTSADLVASPGAGAVFSGSITNTTGAPLPIDLSIEFTTSPETPYYQVDFATLLVNLNLVVPVGGYTGPLFSVAWDANVSGGTYGVGQFVVSSITAAADPPTLGVPFTFRTPGVGPFCTQSTGYVAASGSVASQDSTGWPLIVYHDATTGTLAEARYDGTVWTTTPIASGIGSAAAPSLVLDQALRPHVAFVHSSAGKLVHAWNPGGVWQTEDIDAGVGAGAKPTLVLDALGGLHVSYFDAVAGDLKYARHVGAGWVVEVPDTTGIVGRHSSVTTDDLGRAFIAYTDDTRSDLRLARKVGAGWVSEVVDSAGIVGSSPSVIWNAGALAVSYRRETAGKKALKFAAGLPGAWSTAVVDSFGDPGASSVLRMSAFGQPRIAYHDAASNAVRYATLMAGAWVRGTVTGSATAALSMAQNESDKPFLSTIDAGSGLLRFASIDYCGVVAVPGGTAAGVEALRVYPARPNPFTTGTTIAFTLARGGEVRVRIYDAAGRVVAEPLRRVLTPGSHAFAWSGAGRGGRRLAPGAYLYEVRLGEEVRTGRMVLIR